MEHVQLGRSPVHVSRVIFGSMAIGSARSNPERRIRTIRAAIAAGITSIDTAPLYDLGTCEQAVGEAIRGVGSRVQILSKVGLRWDDPHGDLMFRTVDAQGQSVDVRRNSRPASVRLEVERSLRNLGVETLDVVQVHIRDPLTPIEDTMGALADLLRQGKLRAIGLSTDFSPDEVLEAQRALGDIPLASLQLQYSLLHRDGEAALIPLARDRQIGVLARSPLGMGLLTGRMPPSSAFGADDLRAVTPSFHRSNLRRVAQALKIGIEPVATRHGVPFTTVALAWVLSRPGVSSVVVGASWPEQTRANAEAAELKLDAGEQLVMQQAFDRVELDPNAGVGLAQRSLVHARRIAAGLRRRLAPNARTRESSIAS
jgi:aryl-alcohol dehydrogenase-like predicted oxidoreductase